MKAVLHTGATLPWVPDPERRPWALLPVGNRPVLEYWLETCVALGIREVRIVLGEGADLIEAYAGGGENWGLDITYSFLKSGQDADSFPRRSPELWSGDGLLYLKTPLFPLRTGTEPPAAPGPGETLRFRGADGDAGFVTRDELVLRQFLHDRQWPQAGTDHAFGLSAGRLDTPGAYYDLNMRMVRGEIKRYVAPGYSVTEGSYVGFNVVTPPSCQLNPPLMIGNNSRFQPLSAAGPDAVIGNRVVIDSQTEVRSCVVLDGTYLGRNLELEGKIVAGTHLIDPETGTVLTLDDPLLLGQVGDDLPGREALHALAGKLPALLLWVAMAPFFALLAPLICLTGRGAFRRLSFLDRRDAPLTLPVFEPRPGSRLGMLFGGMSLDRWLWLPRVLSGRLALCGHAPIPESRREVLRAKLPRTVPGAFSEDLILPESANPHLWQISALHYLHERSLTGDLALLFRVLTRRILISFATEPAGEPADA